MRWTELVAAFGVAAVSGQFLVSRAFPPGVSDANCSVEASEGVRVLSGETRITCPSLGTLLCKFAGSEPQELPLQEMCEGRRFSEPIRGAVPVTVLTDETVISQWARIVGTELQVIARQEHSSGQISLPVAPLSDRVIRFIRSGSSPVSLPAGELVRLGKWTLPKPVGGGELLLLTGRSDFQQPRQYLLNDVPLTPTVATNGVASISGLEPGQYRLRPVFTGGVYGVSKNISVLAGQTSVLDVDSEKLSALRVIVSPEWCQPNVSISLVDAATKPAASAVAVRCRQEFEGLLPGVYTIALNGGPGTPPKAKVVLHPAKQHILTLAPTRVSGAITLAGQPLDGITKVFSQTPDAVADDDSACTTDASGQCSTVLPGPGVYYITLKDRQARVLGQIKRIDAQSGENIVDWPVKGAEIDVRIVGWTHRNPLDIVLTRTRPQEIGAFRVGLTLRPEEADSLRIRAVAAGEYSIYARERSRSGNLVSATSDLAISDDSGTVPLTLSLRNYAVRVLVVNGAGQRIDGAAVLTEEGDRLRESQLGEFVADSRPGEVLSVSAPGFVPVCKATPQDGRLTVALTAGQQRTVSFTSGSVLSEPLGQLVWSESACPIPVRRLEWRAAPSVAGESRFIVANFPDSADVWFVKSPFDGPSQWIRVSIAADGTVRLGRER